MQLPSSERQKAVAGVAGEEVAVQHIQYFAAATQELNVEMR